MVMSFQLCASAWWCDRTNFSESLAFWTSQLYRAIKGLVGKPPAHVAFERGVVSKLVRQLCTSTLEALPDDPSAPAFPTGTMALAVGSAQGEWLAERWSYCTQQLSGIRRALPGWQCLDIVPEKIITRLSRRRYHLKSHAMQYVPASLQLQALLVNLKGSWRVIPTQSSRIPGHFHFTTNDLVELFRRTPAEVRLSTLPCVDH